MLHVRYNKEQVRALLDALSSSQDAQKDDLKAQNVSITNDTTHSVDEDFNSVKNYLKTYITIQYETEDLAILKPKGKICLLLSYNEPFIMNIIPVLNAVIAGNDVTVRPSSLASQFASDIWEYVFGKIPDLRQLLHLRFVEKG